MRERERERQRDKGRERTLLSLYAWKMTNIRKRYIQICQYMFLCCSYRGLHVWTKTDGQWRLWRGMFNPTEKP